MGLLYTNLKIFRHKDKIDSLPFGVNEILPPIHIRIKPTNVCNHNCRYCAYRNSDLQLGADMRKQDFIPKEKILEIVDDLDEMGTKAITFSGGGEPFCYPYLLDTVKKISQTKISFAAITNGSLLKGELAEMFAFNGTWLRVSIDGWDGGSYASYRGVSKDEFDKVMDNIQKFKNLGGGCFLGVSVIVDKDNSLHLYKLLSRLKDTGVDSVKISPCIKSNDVSLNNQYHSSIFNVVKEQTTMAKEDLSGDSFEIYDSYHLLESKFKKNYSWCPYLQILPIIGADLNIYSCQDKAYNLKEGLLGSIRERHFKEFWYSEKSKFFRINPSKHCNHHCVSNTKNQLIHEYLNADPAHAMFV